MARPVIESLFPEFCNQGGDNGNAMSLRESLPEATFIETSYGEVPYFVDHEPSLIMMNSMPEMQQENAIKNGYRQDCPKKAISAGQNRNLFVFAANLRFLGLPEN